MLVVAEPEQAARRSGPLGQVERPPRLRDRPPQGLGLPVRVRRGRSRSARSSASASVVGDDLARACRRPRRTRCAATSWRRTSSSSAAASAATSSGPVRRSARGHVERRLARLELVEEPEASWAKRERQRALGAGHGSSGGAPRRRAGPRAAASIRAGEPGERGRLEQGAQRELDAERVAEPRDDLGRQERVAAEVEEAVVDADALDARARSAQTPRAPPRPARAARRRPLAAARSVAPGRGQRVAVDLAVGRQRQRVERPRTPPAPCTRAAAPEEGAQLAAAGAGRPASAAR